MSITKDELNTFLKTRNIENFNLFEWYITVQKKISEDEWEKINKIKCLEYEGHDTGFNKTVSGDTICDENFYFSIENTSNSYCKSIAKKLSKIVGEIKYSITESIKVSFYDDKQYCGKLVDKKFDIKILK
jgi:hypothetical protein